VQLQDGQRIRLRRDRFLDAFGVFVKETSSRPGIIFARIEKP
jgi:hypothetical protein